MSYIYQVEYDAFNELFSSLNKAFEHAAITSKEERKTMRKEIARNEYSGNADESIVIWKRFVA